MIREERNSMILPAWMLCGRSLYRSFLATFVFAFMVLPVVTMAETLDDAWAIALSVDQRLQASQLETESVRWNYSAAKSLRNPKLSNVTAYTWLSDTPSFDATIPGMGSLSMPFLQDEFAVNSTMVAMPLYTGGQIQHKVSAAASQVAAAEREQVRTCLDVKLEVAAAYVTVLRANRAVEVAQANVTSLQTHVRVVESMLKQALVAKSDLLAAQVALADAEQKVLQAHNGVDIAGAAYNRLLQRSLAMPVDLQELTVFPSHESLEILSNRAIHTRPELARLSAQMNALRCQAESIRGANRPQVQVVGGYTYLENENISPEGYGSLSFAMEWIPYDGGVAHSRSNSLQRKASAIGRLQANATTAIQLEVRKAWLDEHEARKRIDVTSKATEQADENLRVTRNRYQQGIGTNTEVLDAETLRALTFNNYYNAIYDAIISTFKLHRAVGTL